MGVTMYEDASYRKWIGYVDDALSCLDFQTLTWKHLPGSGGFYDQDEKVMYIWNMVKAEYCEAMKDPAIIQYLERKRGKS